MPGHRAAESFNFKSLAVTNASIGIRRRIYPSSWSEFDPNAFNAMAVFVRYAGSIR